MSNTLKYLDRPFEVQERPLWFHLKGLSETATGYGSRLRSTKVIRIEGEKIWRRVYVMQYSNAGTAYVMIKGERLILRSADF